MQGGREMNQNIKLISGILLNLFKKQKAVVAIIFIFVFMMFPDTNFYTGLNLAHLLGSVSTNAIIAFGVTFAVICKGCDLSVGSVMVVAGIIAIMLLNDGMTLGFAIAYAVSTGIIVCFVLALTLVSKGRKKLFSVLIAILAGIVLGAITFAVLLIMPMNMLTSILLAVLAGTIVGFVNGFLIVHQKTEAFIITLGMGMLVQGIALHLTDAVNVSANDPSFQRIANDTFLGIPYIAIITLVLGVLAFLLLRFTGFGRNVYALGGDYEVAEHSGINVIYTKWMAFVLTGTFAAIAGVLAASRMNTGVTIAGVVTPLMVNCGVVLGGTSFAGGVGGVGRSFIGIFLLFLLRNSLGMLGIAPFQQQFVLGIIIVMIISLDCYAAKRRKEAV